MQYSRKSIGNKVSYAYHTSEFKLQTKKKNSIRVFAFSGLVNALWDCLYYKYNTFQKVLSTVNSHGH